MVITIIDLMSMTAKKAGKSRRIFFVFLQLMSHLFMVVLLTGLTQIGGIIYFLVFLLFWKASAWVKWGSFVASYLLITFFLVPPLAEKWGRIPVQKSPNLQAVSWYVDICNRNYVKPELNQVLQDQAETFQKQYPEIQLVYLDAAHPFIDGFPLLPHRSHDDGEKIDLAFVYHRDGELTNQKPAFSGYGVFLDPTDEEANTTSMCLNQGYWQYDITKYTTLGVRHSDLRVHEAATAQLLRNLTQDRRIGKILLEPHLTSRWNLDKRKVRFSGCYAVRHDDHIHIQL
ncbi:MAG: hypothetical protein AAFR66_03295 [Bacteroidota bacterium]